MRIRGILSSQRVSDPTLCSSQRQRRDDRPKPIHRTTARSHPGELRCPEGTVGRPRDRGNHFAPGVWLPEESGLPAGGNRVWASRLAMKRCPPSPHAVRPASDPDRKSRTSVTIRVQRCLPRLPAGRATAAASGIGSGLDHTGADSNTRTPMPVSTGSSRRTPRSIANRRSAEAIVSGRCAIITRVSPRVLMAALTLVSIAVSR